MSKRNAIRRIVAAVTTEAWNITPSKLDQIREFVELRSAGVEFSEVEVLARIGGDSRPANTLIYRRIGTDAVIPLSGVLAAKMNMMTDISGGTSTQQFSAAVTQAAGNPDVKRIVLDIDSPGGTATGSEEAAKAVRAAQAVKPVVAVATGEMCSAAYYIASAAGEVVASPSTTVGSIGVIGLHIDQSKADEAAGQKYTVITAGKHKADGFGHEPLTVQGKATLQETIDAHYRMFVDAVATNRGISAADVEANYGQGKDFLAKEALSRGMIDRIATLQEVLNQQSQPASAGPNHSKGSFSAMDPTVMQALIKTGLVDANATADTAKAVLGAWYSVKGKTQGDDVAAILADLAAKPATTPKVEPQAAKPANVATGTGTPLDEEAILAKDRARREDIQAIGEGMEIDAKTIQVAIDDGTDLEAFREIAIEDACKRNQPVGKVEPGRAAADKFSEAAVETMLRQCGEEIEGKPSPYAQSLEYASALDIVRESFGVRGERIGHVDNETLASAALGNLDAMRQMGVQAASGSYEGPGSYPQILSALASKTLDKRPDTYGTSYHFWAHKRKSVPDFKPTTLIRTGTFGEFPHHPDGEPFQKSKFSTEFSWLRVESYGDEFDLTPRMVVDDDLGAFMDALKDKAKVHELTLNRLCINLLTGNVACSDGNNLFDNTNHGNDIASGAAPVAAQLAAMRLKTRQQTELGGRKLNQTIYGLLIPEALESTTELFLSPNVVVVPVTSTTGEQWRGKVQYWIDPMLTDDSAVKYYGFVSPTGTHPIVYAHQQGFEKMKKRNYYDPKTNCRSFQFEACFAAAVNTWNGVIRNAGA